MTETELKKRFKIMPLFIEEKSHFCYVNLEPLNKKTTHINTGR